MGRSQEYRQFAEALLGKGADRCRRDDWRTASATCASLSCAVSSSAPDVLQEGVAQVRRGQLAAALPAL